MSLSVRFLGTSAARPTVERNVTSIALVREGETLLFDCGEGTQRQMMRYGVSFGLRDIFFTHFHGDHLLGVIGLLRTLGLQGREEPMRLWGPRGAERVLRQAVELGVERSGFPVEIRTVQPGEAIERGEYAIIPYAAEHRGQALGYALKEAERRGRFNPALAQELGIPEGPLWGQLHRGHSVTLEDGRTIDPAVLVGPTRPGRKVVLSGDSRPAQSTVEAAQGADLLVHEATFANEEAQRARETGHSTAQEAAALALRAGVRTLAITHFSARYSHDSSPLLREAKAVFPNVVCARDGMLLDVAYEAEATEPISR
ncbi:MAG TPA: ribonuclease Z [Gemmatimonadaceae bacterium]|nr:ribonuclease Z [Gemmatimonadaceae bacterium]